MFPDKNQSAKMQLKNSLFIDEISGSLDVESAYTNLFQDERFASLELRGSLKVDYSDSEDVLVCRKQGQDNTLWYFYECLYSDNLESIKKLASAKNKKQKATNFFTILHLVQMLTGPLVMLKTMSNSEMWVAIEKGNLKNPVFAGLHFLNFFNHLKSGDELKKFKFHDICNIYDANNHKIGTHEKILETFNKIASPFVNALIEIVMLPYFDELFLEYFGEVAKGFESKSELLFYINNSLTGYNMSLVSQKLESLGFTDR